MLMPPDVEMEGSELHINCHRAEDLPKMDRGRDADCDAHPTGLCNDIVFAFIVLF